MLTYDGYAAHSLTSSSLKISRIIAFLVEMEIVIMNFSASTSMPKSIDINVVTRGWQHFSYLYVLFRHYVAPYWNYE